MKCMLVKQKLFVYPGFSFVFCGVQLGKLIQHQARYTCMLLFVVNHMCFYNFSLRGYVQHMFFMILS